MELYKAALKVHKAQEEEYEAFKKALNDYVENEVLTKEAAKKGVKKEDLIIKEVNEKIGAPSEAEIKAFYDEKKINRPFDSIKDRIAEYLKSQKTTEKRAEYIAKLMEKYNAKTSIPEFSVPKPIPPKLEIAVEKDNAFQGPADAPITIVEFSDYQCPFCKRAEETVIEVMKKYKNQVKLVFRHYPLPFHKEAKPAAMAAECAKEQGKFWEYHEQLFNNQKALKNDDLKKYAQNVKLDQNKFNECLSSEKYASIVEKDIAAGKEYGVTGTPAFFINGRMISGARPIEDFVELIEAEKKGS